MTSISAPRLLVDGQLLDGGTVHLNGERIAQVTRTTSDAELSLSSGFLTAGLVDLQVNGFAGVDFVSGSLDAWGKARRAIARTGVTSFVPTFITAPIDTLVSALHRTATFIDAPEPAGARPLGIHLEGPFLSPERKGAHDESAMCDASPEAIEALLFAADGRLLMITLAPERPHALEAIARLTSAGVTVSLGHSNADAETALAGFAAGAGMVTHLFNAMPPLAHRDPGLAGVALTDPRAHLGLIVDLHHLDPRICQLAFNAAPDRVVLVTDAIAAATMQDGEYELGGAAVMVRDGLPRRSDGTIAGSALTLDAAVRNAVNVCAVPLAQALDSATRIPAETVGGAGIGNLATGLLADLVWWSDDLYPQRVWIDGTEVDLTDHHV